MGFGVMGRHLPFLPSAFPFNRCAGRECHRKDLNRIDRHFAEAKELHDKAEYFRRRAAAADL
jgi:hypothetical protein